MGNCTVKTSVPQNVQTMITIPDCYYFCRDKKNLFEILSSKVTKYKFKGRMKSYADSGSGLVGNGCIIVVGGSDSSGLLTSRVFMIDPINKSATELPSIPKPVKEGHLLEHRNCYYFVGGTVEAEDIDSNTPEEGGPIMVYDTEKNFWSIYLHNKDSKDNIN